MTPTDLDRKLPSVGWLTKLRERYFALVDRVDGRIDKPAEERGTFTSGGEQMIDDEDGIGRWMGRSAANRRSGYGRGGTVS